MSRPGMDVMTGVGYSSPTYAAALHHVGVPVQVGPSTLIRRTSGGNPDLVAPYPMLRCRDWDALGDALLEVGDVLSVTAVTDPFSDPGPELLARPFPDLVRPWKAHHVVDLGSDEPSSSHHRRNLRKADVEVRRSSPAAGAAPALVDLYDQLRSRHGVTGPADFPADSLCAQLAVPGAASWVATADGEPAGVVVAFVDGEHAWYHLGAASARGYERRAMFALFHRMIGDLREEGVRLLDLGAGAGADGASAGLERFKRGWAHHQLPTHLVGRILDTRGYEAAVRAAGGPATWFPAYRSADT